VFNNIITSFPRFLLCGLLLGFISQLTNACGTSLNQKNYLECRELLEKDRQIVRVLNGFSYNSQSFEECRAPARFQTDND